MDDNEIIKNKHTGIHRTSRNYRRKKSPFTSHFSLSLSLVHSLPLLIRILCHIPYSKLRGIFFVANFAYANLVKMTNMIKYYVLHESSICMKHTQCQSKFKLYHEEMFGRFDENSDAILDCSIFFIRILLLAAIYPCFTVRFICFM